MSTHSIPSYLELLANYTLYRFGCLSVPTDLIKLAHGLGVGQIKYEPMSAEGCVEQNGDTTLIRIRHDAPTVRQRFTLAHELGHIILNKLREKPSTPQYRAFRHYGRVGELRDEESIVDELAGLLLLPTSYVRQRLNSRIELREIVRIAHEAQISLSAALLRTIAIATEPCVAFMARRTPQMPLHVKWSRYSRSVDRSSMLNDLHSPGILNLLVNGTSSVTGSLRWIAVQVEVRTFHDVESRYCFARIA